MNEAEIIVSTYRNTPVVTSFIQGKLEYLSFVRKSELHNIYLGKVDHIVKNINAAFVKYDGENIGYLPLEKITSACVVNRDFSNKPYLVAGDEVIVQIDTEELKTKKARLTTNIAISGRYCVITLGREGVGASIKIDPAKKKTFIEKVKEEYKIISQDFQSKYHGTKFGIIIRTQAGELDENESKIITDDIQKVLSKVIAIIENGSTRTAYSLLNASSEVFSEENISAKKIFDVEADAISDMLSFYKIDHNYENVFEHYLKNFKYLNARGHKDITLIVDSGIHGINSKIDELLSNKIWLKSGGFIIIEQLESFNAIDVNSGKAIKGKSDISEKINLEAADEIMRQIRLRNLSGMILIDFINMKKEEQYNTLIEHVKNLFKLDTVHNNYIDITGLGIMELTRNKNDKSLREIISSL